MNSLKKNHELIRQNEQGVTKSQKHDANLQKNSTLYFQIGLILCLLVTYGLFQMTFETKDYQVEVLQNLPEDDLYVYNEPIKIYEEQTTEQKRQKPVVFTNPDIRDDDDPTEDTPEIFEPKTPENPAPDPGSIVLEEPPVELPPMNVMLVEQVPIFPGCESAKTNDERRKCMSSKMSKFIQKKFDTDLAQGLGLSGVQKINVMFKIDKNGQVIDVKSRAPHPRLEKEANSVIGELPKMTPGKHGDKEVEILYALPIRFEVKN